MCVGGECVAYLHTFILSTNTYGSETAPGPGNTILILVDKAFALRGGMGHRCKQI